MTQTLHAHMNKQNKKRRDDIRQRQKKTITSWQNSYLTGKFNFSQVWSLISYNSIQTEHYNEL
jgi:hypothetical protein